MENSLNQGIIRENHTDTEYHKKQALLVKKFAEHYIDEMKNFPKFNLIVRNEPQTKHYPLIGTSFDYLLRFKIEVENEKGVHIIPDILCNGGGVIVSYFEMVQNLNMDHWSEDYIYGRLDEKMTAAYHRVIEYSKKNSIPMRMAAYTIALESLVEAMTARGWI